MSATAAAAAIFSAMFTPMMMLLLGGFSIAAALEKYDIARRVAQFVLSKAGSKPSIVILACMVISTLASVCVSNVTAPILCFSLVQPLLQRLPAESPIAKCLILGIALAANVGGLTSPIASPQSLIGTNIMTPAPSWLTYFVVSIPLAVISDLAIWLLLLWIYRPNQSGATLELPRRNGSEMNNDGDGGMKDEFQHQEKLTIKQWYIIVITVTTIILWCVENRMEQYVGHLGVVAVFPIICLFGVGILTKDDFNGFLWTVMILAMGGTALGKAVDSSGLLNLIAGGIRDAVDGLPLWGVIWVFLGVMLVVATFISHTVAALIILPVVAEVGAALPDPHSNLLVMLAMFKASGAMGLPVSGFPNMQAIMLEDARGKPYLKTLDFIKGGMPASVFVAILVGTLGYALALALGF